MKTHWKREVAGPTTGPGPMILIYAPPDLGSGIDKDRPDYGVHSWRVGCGRIYETRGGPDNRRWFWSVTVNGPTTRSDRVATLGRQAKSFDRIAIFAPRICWVRMI